MADQRRRVLVLDKDGQAAKSAELSQAGWQVCVERDMAGALARQAAEPFDLIVLEGEALDEWLGGPSADLSAAALDATGQAVAILDGEGRTLWANRRYRELPVPTSDEIAGRGRRLIDADRRGHRHCDTERFRLLGPQGGWYDVAISVIEPGAGQPRIAVAVTQTSESLKAKLEQVDLAGQELVRLEKDAIAKLDIPGRLKLLEDKIIRVCRDVIGFDKFVVRLLDKKSNRLEVILSAGFPEEALQTPLAGEPERNGICGYVAATGKSYICPDVRRDPLYVRGIDGAASSLTCPLYLHHKLVGTFNIESEELDAFTDEDRQVAEVFGRYVAIALNILDLMVLERFQTTGQVASSVASEIAGPLNDILTDATSALDDCNGSENLRAKLQAICENVSKVRLALKSVTARSAGLIGGTPAKPTRDAVLDGKAILVADDEPIIRETISEILSTCGALVETAADGEEAIGLIGRRKYDLVLSDIKMPRHSGYEIFAAAKDADRDVPVVFMTGFGYDPNHTIIRARQEGLSGVLYKPFKVSEFLTLIRDVLRAPVPSPTA